MSFKALIESVERLAKPIVEEFGLELVEAEFATERGHKVLRLYIERPEGSVTLDDCVAVSREFGTALDVEDIVPGRYSLEVSSPGLDRPLKRPEDYKKAVGKRIKIKTTEPIDGRRNFKATLDAFDGKVLFIVDSEGRRFEIELAAVEKARLEIEI